MSDVLSRIPRSPVVNLDTGSARRHGERRPDAARRLLKSRAGGANMTRATLPTGDPQTLALLFAALDSVEAAHGLIERIRKPLPLGGEQRELRGVADLIGRTEALLQSLISTERRPRSRPSAGRAPQEIK
jgi:hypothetical protein